MKFGIGQPVRRTEDVRLVTGRGCYLDDVQVEHTAYAYFVRSSHAHADPSWRSMSSCRRARRRGSSEC